MANELLKKSRTRITAQSSSILTAGKYPEDGSYAATANCMSMDNSISAAAGQPKGAHYLNLELDVTTAPATAATANIYWRGSEDGGTKWTDWRYSHTVGKAIGTTADNYSAGIFELEFDLTEIAVAAVGYGFTSTLYATPKLKEVQ